MKIGQLLVGEGAPCRVVAELGTAHNQNKGLALRLIEDSAEAGADIVKWQTFLPSELVALRGDGPAPEPWAGRSMKSLYEQAALPLTWLKDLVAKCEELGVPWYSSVFGLGGIALLEASGCSAYKLAAGDYARRSLRELVEGTGKPIVRSSPGPRRKQDFTLWCPPGYPQAPLSFSTMRKFDGFSYHGKDPFVPALAAAYGASMIEVHVELDGTPSVLDSHSSLSVSSLAGLVTMAHTATEWRA